MRLREGNVEWTFPDGWTASKYDEWTFYRKQFQRTADRGAKAADFVAITPEGDTLWLIEAKDYTFEPRGDSKESLGIEVARKARDTLAGLFAAAVNGGGDEQVVAGRALGARRIRVVLHLEQPTTKTRIYPTILDRADVLQKLKQVLKAIDPHPMVMDTTHAGGVPWAVAWKPDMPS
jgi:hypothetical protein